MFKKLYQPVLTREVPLCGVWVCTRVGVLVGTSVMGVCVGRSSWRDRNMREVNSVLLQSVEPGLRAIL